MTIRPRLPATTALLLVTLSVLLSGCQAARTAPSVNDIRALMLTSHEKWSTLSGETLTTWRPQNGEAQEVINLFWISHNQARFEMPNSETVLIVNESGVFESYDGGRSFSETHHQDTEAMLAMLPGSLAEIEQDTVYRHPLAMWVASPVIDYIFPTGLAQRSEYEFGGKESVIGRETWVLTFYGSDNGETRLPLAKYWVDKELGITLKAEVQGSNGLSEEMVFITMEVNPVIPEETFVP